MEANQLNSHPNQVFVSYATYNIRTTRSRVQGPNSRTGRSLGKRVTHCSMKIDIVRIQRLSPKIDTHEILRLIPNTKTCQQGQGILCHGSGNAPSAVARGPHTRYVRISVDPSMNISHKFKRVNRSFVHEHKALRARRAWHARLTTAASPRLSPSHSRWL